MDQVKEPLTGDQRKTVECYLGTSLDEPDAKNASKVFTKLVISGLIEANNSLWPDVQSKFYLTVQERMRKISKPIMV